MGKKGRSRRVVVVLVVAVLLLLSDVGNASFLSKLRELTAVVPTASSLHEPPSPSPDPSQEESGGLGKASNNNGTETAEGDKSQPPPPPPPSSLPSPPAKEIINKSSKDKTGVEAAPGENCTGASPTCSLQHSPMLACFLDSQSDVESKALVILVSNEGEGILNVNVSAPNPDDNALLEIPEHRIYKMNLTPGNSSKVILWTEKEKCELEINPTVSPRNNFFRFPSTDKLITPVNGAYFLILTVIVFGGSCAWFMLRRRRRQGGIPYQELEMGESSSTNNIVSAEGWDQDWDDDWDEENAVRSPAPQRTGSISANGLTSRTPNKGTWENDWDD